MKRLLPAILLAASTAAAGPYDRPYSIITTDTAPSADPLVRPVILNRVDGEGVIANKAVVPPGPHKVTVDLPPRKGHRLATQETLELATRACMQYDVVARLESQASQRWTPVVRAERRIPECERKFGIGAAK